MPVRFMMVPSTCGVDEVEMFAGTDVLVLDDLVSSGLAGTIFKRKRIVTALHPAERADYDRKRCDYLRAVLPEMLKAREDVLVIGTHPTDVDLYEYETVSAVQVSDVGMRDLGKLVYGDPLLLQVEYTGVLRSVGDAVDTWYHVRDWREITMLVMRQYPKRTLVDYVLSVVRQKQVLSEIWQDESTLSTWMEDELPLNMHIRKGFLIADYDYLTVIRPKWRDAVVRSLGAAPLIATVFRLPWYVVDPMNLRTLCYRTNINGLPSVSMRGKSIVDFVRSRLASEFTTRELVGTWVGALLCDGMTAVDTLSILGSQTLAPVEGFRSLVVQEESHKVRIPKEYLWMYEAVPDVVVEEWHGPRGMDGRPLVRNVPFGWSPTLPIAEYYHECYGSASMRSEVVRFMHRMHSISYIDVMMRALEPHAALLTEYGPTAEIFDPVLTVMLPGYTYLAAFAASVRMSAVGQLGMDPAMSVMLGYAHQHASVEAVVSVEELAVEASRSLLLSGRVLHNESVQLRVGSKKKLDEAGYCYLCLFAPVHRARLKHALGPYPSFSQVLDNRYVPWWQHGALDQVYVSSSYSSSKSNVPVLHFTLRNEGILLRRFIAAMWAQPLKQQEYVQAMRVGDAGVCYSMQWFIAAIVSWTIVGVFVVGFFCKLFYDRCLGKGGSRSAGVGAGSYRGRY